MGDMVNAPLIQPREQRPIHVVQVVEVTAAYPEQVGGGGVCQSSAVHTLEFRFANGRAEPGDPAERVQVAQSDGERLTAASREPGDGTVVTIQ